MGSPFDAEELEVMKEALRYAYSFALDSPDPSTQNAAIVYNKDGQMISIGVNKFTKGVEITEDILERPKKYSFIEHAERNAIYGVLSSIDEDVTIDPGPHVMVAPWAACADCARAIVQSGIQVLVRHKRDDGTNRWNQSIEWGDQILKAGGVDIIEIAGELGGCEPILFNGESWLP